MISGSNAHLLSKELGTLLTGRHTTIELFPFSYSEYLLFSKKRASASSFLDYMEVGGFPEPLQYPIPRYASELYKDIVERDIIVRFGIKNKQEIHLVLLHLLNNISRPFSYTKIAKHYGIKSVKSVADYVQMALDTYMLFQIPKFSYSYKKQQVNPKKAYAIDHAFARENALDLMEDRGRILENMVFLSLRREVSDIYYHSEEHECDFVFVKKKLWNVVQVTWEINRHNKERELKGLIEAAHFFNIDKGIIVTFDQEDSLIYKNIQINLIPFYKWATQTN